MEDPGVVVFSYQPAEKRGEKKMGKGILELSMLLDDFIAGLHDETEYIELERTRVIEFPGVTHLRFWGYKE